MSAFLSCTKCGCVFDKVFAKEIKKPSWLDKEFDIYKICPCCKNLELI